MDLLLYVWLPLVFVLGTVLGSFLNVCIYRLPLEKSILWPGSRCGHCLQPVRWYDNVPLLSYWWLGGRCRTCKQKFSVRYFFVELLTGLGVAGLFYGEVASNLHHWPMLDPQRPDLRAGLVPYEGWVVFGFHALLLCFLIVAAFCDLDHREIPLTVTMPGTAVGLVGAVSWPWPWPHAVADALPRNLVPGQSWWLASPSDGPRNGLYPWPVWGPLPDWLPPGSWQLGLTTGIVGLLAGTLLLRAVRFLFSTGLGMEALGLGDADLMMMAGAFLGWQPVVAAFFIGVFPALFIGIAGLVLRGDNTLPFGPSLAIGLVLTWLGWHWLGPYVQPLFFNSTLLVLLAVVGGLFMFGSSFFLRLIRSRS